MAAELDLFGLQHPWKCPNGAGYCPALMEYSVLLSAVIVSRSMRLEWPRNSHTSVPVSVSQTRIGNPSTPVRKTDSRFPLRQPSSRPSGDSAAVITRSGTLDRSDFVARSKVEQFDESAENSGTFVGFGAHQNGLARGIDCHRSNPAVAGLDAAKFLARSRVPQTNRMIGAARDQHVPARRVSGANDRVDMRLGLLRRQVFPSSGPKSGFGCRDPASAAVLPSGEIARLCGRHPTKCRCRLNRSHDFQSLQIPNAQAICMQRNEDLAIFGDGNRAVPDVGGHRPCNSPTRSPRFASHSRISEIVSDRRLVGRCGNSVRGVSRSI